MRTLLMLALVLLPTQPVLAGDAQPTVTVEGEILDLGCYTAREARGPEHQECAARCLGNGNPAGIITDDGDVYTIAAAAPAFQPYAAMRAKLVGTTRGKLLKAKTMQIWVDDAWQEVPMTKFGTPVAESSE